MSNQASHDKIKKNSLKLIYTGTSPGYTLGGPGLYVFEPTDPSVYVSNMMIGGLNMVRAWLFYDDSYPSGGKVFNGIYISPNRALLPFLATSNGSHPAISLNNYSKVWALRGFEY